MYTHVCMLMCISKHSSRCPQRPVLRFSELELRPGIDDELESSERAAVLLAVKPSLQPVWQIISCCRPLGPYLSFPVSSHFFLVPFWRSPLCWRWGSETSPKFLSSFKTVLPLCQHVCSPSVWSPRNSSESQMYRCMLVGVGQRIVRG